MLTSDDETTFSPEYVAMDFAERFFFIVSIGLVAVIVFHSAFGIRCTSVGGRSSACTHVSKANRGQQR
jgi:succinate dehydrogenase/fumarate reductase cytochrome b subunit